MYISYLKKAYERLMSETDGLVLTDKGLKMFHNTVMDNPYSRTWARRYFWESGEGTHLTWLYVKRADNQIHNAE